MVDESALVASGRDADVYALDADRVLRRYRYAGDTAAEAAIMRWVAGLGYPVPLVHEAAGADLVMQRIHGPTMLQAMLSGDLGAPEAAAVMARLHRELHELPVPASHSDDPASRILHLDLHPQNILMAARGPVVIDWTNAAPGPPALDIALSALILAEVAADPTSGLCEPAAQLLAGFLAHFPDSDIDDPVPALPAALRYRRANPTLSRVEIANLDRAAALVAPLARRGG